MDVSLLPATTEQLPTTDAKSLENGQTEPVEGVALPVFSALLALTQAADPTVEADAEALAIRQALAGEGKNLPPATLVGDVRPSQLLPSHAASAPERGHISREAPSACARRASSGAHVTTRKVQATRLAVHCTPRPRAGR